jgi:microcin C transport system permease protein
MLAYVVRRLALMLPTIFGILFLTFLIMQYAPGGPVEQIISKIQEASSGGPGGESGAAMSSGSRYRGSEGLDPAFKREIEKQFGFDKPPAERFMKLLGDYGRFDFGRSFFSKVPVLDLIRQKMPVSISLGLWMTLISYLVSIPLGIRKAVSDGSIFDVATSFFVSIGFAIPAFLWGVLLATLFCGAYFPIFPLRGLTSENFAQLSLMGKIGDYLWHIAMPVTALTLGSFATITALTKNSFLDEINKAYVQTARMKGLTPNRVLYGHVFRNAMMIVIAGFPGAFVSAFFTGALVIEIIFSLDGLGRLSYDAVIARDYPIVFANIYIFALFGLVVNLISDLTYTWVDPRIDFERRDV